MNRNIIKEKKEEMRQLVGGKYLDMLQVSDTTLSMNQEFSTLSSSINSILTVLCCCGLLVQICDSIESEFTYKDDLDAQQGIIATITPESLWEEYDMNNMLNLSKDLVLFKNHRILSLLTSGLEEENNNSMNNEMFTYFPEIAMKKCIQRIFEIPSSSREVVKRIVSLSIGISSESCCFLYSLIYL